MDKNAKAIKQPCNAYYTCPGVQYFDYLITPMCLLQFCSVRYRLNFGVHVLTKRLPNSVLTYSNQRYLNLLSAIHLHMLNVDSLSFVIFVGRMG